MKITPEMTRKVGFREARPEPGAREESIEAPDQVHVVTESTEDEIVAAAKRNASGEALPKQHRKGSGIPIPPLLNDSQVPLQMQIVPRAKARTSEEKTKRKTKTRKPGIPEHVGKYKVLEEPARAPSGLTFGQLIRGDADDAKVEIRKALAKGARAGRSVIAQAEDGAQHRQLKVVTVRMYGTPTQALLDSGAVPNLMSACLADTLYLSPLPTRKSITVADGHSTVSRGFLTGVHVSFGNVPVSFNFLVVDGTPFDIIIGCPALEMLQARIDMGEHHVTVTIGEQDVQLGLEHDTRFCAIENVTDSEDFTSYEEGGDAGSDSDEENYVVAIVDAFPYEPDLALGADLCGDDDDELPPLYSIR